MPPAEKLGHYLPTWKLTRKQRENYNVKHVELIMRQPDRPWKMRPRKLKKAGIRDLWFEQDQDTILVGGRPAADYTSVPGQDGRNQRLVTEREAKVKESGEKSRAKEAALTLAEKERSRKHSKTAAIEALEHDSAELESKDSGQDKDGNMGRKEDDTLRESTAPKWTERSRNTAGNGSQWREYLSRKTLRPSRNIAANGSEGAMAEAGNTGTI